MTDRACVLADAPRFGSAFGCGECGNIHLKAGPFDLTLAPKAYLELVSVPPDTEARGHTGRAEQEGLRNSPSAN